jgi:sulfite reductase alpha subunit-like flavoprotein
LTLSMLIAAAAPSDWLVYRWKVRAEARKFADSWFQFLIHDEPQKAHQLTVWPASRQSLNDSLWAYYRNSEKYRRELENYVKVPLVRTLLAMGPKARPRFYSIASQSHDGDNDQVELQYAVTYEEEGQRKSFIVVMELIRMKLPSGSIGWRILQASVVTPPKK